MIKFLVEFLISVVFTVIGLVAVIGYFIYKVRTK